VLLKYKLKRNPEFNAVHSAQLAIDRKIENLTKQRRQGEPLAAYEARVAEGNRWKNVEVVKADYDDDPKTDDNILLVDRTRKTNNVLAVDGYYLASRIPDLDMRAMYEMFPTREIRHKYNYYLPHYKKWLRKFRTKADRELNPFTQEMAIAIESNVSVYEHVRDMVKQVMDEKNVKPKPLVSEGETTNEGGSELQKTVVTLDVEGGEPSTELMIAPPNYLKLLAKVTGVVYRNMIAYLVALSPTATSKIGQSYNWHKNAHDWLHNTEFMNLMKATWVRKAATDEGHQALLDQVEDGIEAIITA
jgi:hypothetical protein